VHSKFQRLLDITQRKVYTRDRLGQAVPERLELVSVATVANDELWGDYMARREVIRREISEDNEGFQQYVVDTVAPQYVEDGLSAESIAKSLSEDFAEPLLKEANEVFLFHGTSEIAANQIATHDFKVNLAGSGAGTLYGRGLYLAENSTKADEYTRPAANNIRYLLVCRVVLGRLYYTDEQDVDPRACEDKCLRGKFHGVLGDRKKCRGTFREFVVFDEDQVYANYILGYRRVDPPTSTGKRCLQVMCPPGVAVGATLQVTAPDGTVLQVLVPAGVVPGQQFMVQY